MRKMKVLSTVPSFKLLGGVANHFQGLDPHWTIEMNYLTIGRRKYLPAYVTIIPDILKLFFVLLFHKYDLILINTSLKRIPIFRDSMHVLISKFFCTKIVVFFHGWDSDYESQLNLSHKRFMNVFNKSSLIYVLSSEFKNSLVKMGISVPIKLTTTKVSDSLINNFDISIRTDGHVKSLLFMARVEKDKGVDISIKTFQELKVMYPDLKLYVCGTGNYLDEMKKYVEQNRIADVFFMGFVKGDERIKFFKQSQIFLLPTTHGEGMATSVLEAMAMGMVVITRPVGGVVDFFENKKMGYLIESTETADYVHIIGQVIKHPHHVSEICVHNYKYAKEHFLASKVAQQLEFDFQQINNQ